MIYYVVIIDCEISLQGLLYFLYVNDTRIRNPLFILGFSWIITGIGAGHILKIIRYNTK